MREGMRKPSDKLSFGTTDYILLKILNVFNKI